MSEVAELPSESVGEGVAVRSVRVSWTRTGHRTTTIHVQNRLGREWLKRVAVCRRVLLLTQLVRTALDKKGDTNGV